MLTCSQDTAIAGHVQMTAYAQKCPNSKLILAGYSSGGQGATDILAGGGGELFNGCIQPDTPPLDHTTSPATQSKYIADGYCAFASP
jgi:hypothetical protein